MASDYNIRQHMPVGFEARCRRGMLLNFLLAVPATAVVVTDQKMAKVEDRANHMVYVTEFDGAVYNADGKPFLDKARYQVVALVDVGVTAGGYKTFTEADGSKVLTRWRAVPRAA
jgi:hypothetical protein